MEELKRLIRTPPLIEDPRLRQQVIECIEVDDNYSPLVGRIKRFAVLLGSNEPEP